MTIQADTIADDEQGTQDAAPVYILLGPPKKLTIPILSLQGEAGRPASEIWSRSETDESKLLDKQALGELRKGIVGRHAFVTTRHKVGVRSAWYASWLTLDNAELAQAFLTKHPSYGYANLLAKALQRTKTITHDLEQGLSKGRFDLSGQDDETRYRKAKLYVASIDELRRLDATIQDFRQLCEITDFHCCTSFQATDPLSSEH